MIMMTFILVPVVGFWIADIVASQPKQHELEYKTKKKKTHHVIITGHIDIAAVTGILTNLLSPVRAALL